MENKKQIKPLPMYLKKLILKVSNIIEEKEFVLYGGAPIDYLFSGRRKVNDLDIAINKTSKKDITNLKEILVKKGFNIIVPFREYTVRKTKKVYLMYAQKKKLVLDICFLNDYDLASSLFNLDNLYCRFPELDIVDNYNSVEGIKRKKITFTRSLTKENPYLLLSRFVYLCAKYQIYPMDDFENKEILFKIKEAIESVVRPTGSDQFSSCLNSILKSIIRSDDRKYFLKNLINSGILIKIMPVLDRSLRLVVKTNSIRLDKIKTKKNLIFYLSDALKDLNDKREFLELISCLRVRNWEPEYNYLSNIKL